MAIAIETLDNFLQEWHPDYSGSDRILWIDLLEQYLGLLDDECRTKHDMMDSDIEWIAKLDQSPEEELKEARAYVFSEAVEEWAKAQLSEQIIELKLKYKI